MTRCLLGYTTRRPSSTRNMKKKKKQRKKHQVNFYITLFLITKHIIFGPKTQNQIEAKNIPEISSMFSYINKGVA